MRIDVERVVMRPCARRCAHRCCMALRSRNNGSGDSIRTSAIGAILIAPVHCRHGSSVVHNVRRSCVCTPARSPASAFSSACASELPASCVVTRVVLEEPVAARGDDISGVVGDDRADPQAAGTHRLPRQLERAPHRRGEGCHGAGSYDSADRPSSGSAAVSVVYRSATSLGAFARCSRAPRRARQGRRRARAAARLPNR